MNTPKRGTVVWSGSDDGIVLRVTGSHDPAKQRTIGGWLFIHDPSNDGEVDIVWHDHYSRNLPLSLVMGGPPWKVSDRVESEETIQKRTAECDAAMADAAAESKRAGEEYAAAKLRLPSEYPWLMAAVNAGDMSGHVLGANNIRRELARAYPGVTFSIRSKSYSMGSSIDVAWTGGPGSRDVQAITGKYSRGAWTEVFGGAKYVHCQRRSEHRHEAQSEPVAP